MVGSHRWAPVTWTLVKSSPQHCTLQYKKKCEIRVEPNLFRLVNVLGFGSSLVGGGGGGGGDGWGGWEENAV